MGVISQIWQTSCLASNLCHQSFSVYSFMHAWRVAKTSLKLWHKSNAILAQNTQWQFVKEYISHKTNMYMYSHRHRHLKYTETRPILDSGLRQYYLCFLLCWLQFVFAVPHGWHHRHHWTFSCELQSWPRCCHSSGFLSGSVDWYLWVPLVAEGRCNHFQAAHWSLCDEGK